MAFYDKRYQTPEHLKSQEGDNRLGRFARFLGRVGHNITAAPINAPASALDFLLSPAEKPAEDPSQMAAALNNLNGFGSQAPAAPRPQVQAAAPAPTPAPTPTGPSAMELALQQFRDQTTYQSQEDAIRQEEANALASVLNALGVSHEGQMGATEAAFADAAAKNESVMARALAATEAAQQGASVPFDAAAEAALGETVADHSGLNSALGVNARAGDGAVQDVAEYLGATGAAEGQLAGDLGAVSQDAMNFMTGIANTQQAASVGELARALAASQAVADAQSKNRLAGRLDDDRDRQLTAGQQQAQGELEFALRMDDQRRQQEQEQGPPPAPPNPNSELSQQLQSMLPAASNTVVEVPTGRTEEVFNQETGEFELVELTETVPAGRIISGYNLMFDSLPADRDEALRIAQDWLDDNDHLDKIYLQMGLPLSAVDIVNDRLGAA